MSQATRGEIVRGLYEEFTTGTRRVENSPNQLIGPTPTKKKRIFQKGSVVTNFTAAARRFSLFIVPTSGTANDDTVVLSNVVLNPNETIHLPDLVIKGEDSVWMSADDPDSVNAYISYGTEWTS